MNLSLILILLSGCSSSQTLVSGQSVEVKRGDININVSTDGNLKMPNSFDLRFGTTGQVDQILVEEGDTVKKGALLATLDDSTQINAIKTALFNIQTAQNNITFGCDIDHLPFNYPDLSVSRMADEAKKDIDTTAGYFKQGDYKDAGYWLVMTYFDVQVCEDLIKSRPNAAVLAGAKTNSAYYPDPTAGSSIPISSDNQKAVDYLHQYRQKLLSIASEMKVGDYKKIALELEAARQEMIAAGQMAKSTISIKDRLVFKYADTPTSVDFLQSSLRSLQDLEDYLAQDDALPVEAAKKLYVAKLNLMVGSDVLQNQTLTFESGGSINWQTLQTYNLSLQSAEIALYKAKQAIMQTAIIAPSDGDVVAVDLKKSYVLSAQDYSSRVAVQLVDTKTIRFDGVVDEIDIAKVKPGQKVNITVDAVPNKVFTGMVKFISPFGTKVGNVIKFPIQISLDPTDVQLRGGLSATADILAGSATNVLLVPVSVIINTPGGPMVLVVNETTGNPERRRITVGIQNFQFAEVKSGLNEGDKVQVPGQGAGINAPITQPRGGLRSLR